MRERLNFCKCRDSGSRAAGEIDTIMEDFDSAMQIRFSLPKSDVHSHLLRSSSQINEVGEVDLWHAKQLRVVSLV